MADKAATSSISRERWTQLIAGVICMIMIANLQYGWTLFVRPINAAHGWSIAAIQVAFSIFVALETWLTPIEGWIVDRIGPRNGPKLMVAFGGVFIALGWIINSKAGSLEMLYFGAAISGIGGGAIYATAVGQAVKWFPDRRGLAVGLTAAGFGAGAALTVSSDPRSDRKLRLRSGLPLVRPRARRGRLPAGVAVARAGARRTQGSRGRRRCRSRRAATRRARC